MGGETVAKKDLERSFSKRSTSTVGDRFLKTIGSLPNTTLTGATVDRLKRSETVVFQGNCFLRRRAKRALKLFVRCRDWDAAAEETVQADREGLWVKAP